MPIIQTREQLLYTLILVVVLGAVTGLKRHFGGANGARNVETAMVRVLRLVFGPVMGPLQPEGPMSVEDYLTQLKSLASFTTVPLGLRVRGLLLLLAVGRVAASGFTNSIADPRAVIAVAIVSLLQPLEWDASHAHRLPSTDRWKTRMAAVAATMLGAWSVFEMVGPLGPGAAFWSGWLVHAIIIGLVVRNGGPGHNARRFSPIGWLLIAVGQFDAAWLPGAAGAGWMAATALLAGYAALGAFREARGSASA